MEEEEVLHGLADADARLGRPFPLPAGVPLARWVHVRAVGVGAEVVWALDDTRRDAPGGLAVYAGSAPPPERDVAWDGPDEEVRLAGGAIAQRRRCAYREAQPSLRPVTELRWRDAGLHLRVTAQGPWDDDALRALAASIRAASG